MKILFVHPNFPGQFKHLAKAAVKCDHEVYFLCQTHFGREIHGLTRLKLKGDFGDKALNSKKLGILDRTKYQSEQFREGYINLRNNGWKPDIVISHSGFGSGLYVKETWPTTHHISYLEWWFNPLSEFFTYDENNHDIGINRGSIKKHYDRNLYLSLELCCSDKIVSPTFWQRSQLPSVLKKSCTVIFDGIDLSKFQSAFTNDNSTPILTYGTRGMDPIRAFPQLIKSLPKILQTNKKLRVEIAGNAESFYGSAPKGYSNWKEWALEFLENEQLERRVIWKGYMTEEAYIDWLRSSWCHLYFSHPFVTSWSLLEALAIGIPIVASNTEAVSEICGGCEGVELVDHRSTNEIVTGATQAIEDFCYRKRNFYRRNLQNYSVEDSLNRWEAVAGVELTTQN